MLDILNEAGFNIDETTFIYIAAILVIILVIVSLVTKSGSVKAVLKVVAEAIIVDQKINDEKLEKIFDDLVVKVKTALKKPDEDGKVPLINKLLIVLISIPITKKFVLKQVKNFIDEITENDRAERALEEAKMNLKAGLTDGYDESEYQSEEKK